MNTTLMYIVNIIINWFFVGWDQAPTPPVRDASSLKAVRYGPGHEKFPSWPVPAAADTLPAVRECCHATGGSHRYLIYT
jgi:hypothetical protein